MIDCIIPAAGFSTRMGQWKPLLPLFTKTIIEWSIANAIAGGCRVILVVGLNGDLLYERFTNNSAVEIIENAEYANGMLSSIKTGITLVKTTHFFISLADMPFILADIYQKLQTYKSDQIIFPGRQKKLGHPVLIPYALAPKILQYQNSTQLKPLLKSLSHQCVDIDSPGIFFDIDTEDDYKQAKVLAENLLK